MALELATPLTFPVFPYDPPYDIQVDLMRHLYESIEKKKVTIIESPTGTGKTLSLLCASLTWLKDESKRARKGKIETMIGSANGEADWVIAQTMERHRRELEAEDEESRERLAHARKKDKQLRQQARARVRKKQRLTDTARVVETDDDDSQFLPDNSKEDGDNLSPAVRALMAKLQNPGGSNQDKEEEPICRKIYYASRTHSQLTQVLPELQRLNFGHEISIDSTTKSCGKRGIDDIESSDDGEVPVVRTVPLGSRKQLCINENVRSAGSDIDERCRELLEEKGDKRCSYLPPLDEDFRMLDLRDQILAVPKDIEDLAETGRVSHTCPYFGSRRAIAQAELVTLPYNLLLQNSARAALGIDLTGQIIIIDEAHNLISTLLSLSSVCLPFSTLAISLYQVGIYVTKFRNRLSYGNLLHLKRLAVFLDALKKYVVSWKETAIKPGGNRNEIMGVADLILKMGNNVSGINLLEIEQYLRNSKIARKISGYSDKESEKDKKHTRKGTVPPLHTVENFLISLSASNENGRVSMYLNNDQVELKYQLLNPASNFLDVVESARAVILAGGTMSPISDVVNQLFTQVPPERITSFSCGHIIPSANLLALAMSKGPRGGDLEYKSGNQKDPTVISELGQIILNFTNLVPAGLVVFFPSYNFLNKAKDIWKAAGTLEKFATKKKVLFEPEESTAVDSVLREYSEAINSAVSSGQKGGAVLFAVIGAKLSEGLNFADDLARAVVIVGLPFANLGSQELQERLKYVREQEKANGKKQSGNQKDAGVELYENMCMNAVNQSIGRAIRHKGDWAALVLLDKRYKMLSIRNKLPKWIGSEMKVADTFGMAVKEMGAFYRNKKGNS